MIIKYVDLGDNLVYVAVEQEGITILYINIG